MVIVYDNDYAEIDEITELLNDKISYFTEPTTFDSIAELLDILNLDDQLESDEARLSGMEAKKYKARVEIRNILMRIAINIYHCG